MGIPTSVISGSIAYLLAGAISVGLVYSSRATGILSKDNAEIGTVVVSISFFSLVHAVSKMGMFACVCRRVQELCEAMLRCVARADGWVYVRGSLQVQSNGSSAPCLPNSLCTALAFGQKS